LYEFLTYMGLSDKKKEKKFNRLRTSRPKLDKYS